MTTKLIVCLVALFASMPLGFSQEEAYPADFPESAIDLGTIGAEKKILSYKASIEDIGNIDWFKITFDEPAESLLSLDPQLSLRIIIYDENLSYIDSGEGYVPATLEEGLYFIRVDSRYLETTNYTLTISNIFETEPNDCITDANDIGLINDSIIVGGSIEPMADIDIFLFEVPAGFENYVAISTSVYSRSLATSLVLYEYNESENRYFPMASEEGQILMNLTSGTYKVRVEEYGIPHEISDYMLSISLSSFECDNEPNDSPDEATYLGVLSKGDTLTQNGCIIPEEDIDYYAFNVSESMRVVIETSGDSYEDTEIYLYNDAQKEIDYNDDYGEDEWSLIERELDQGVYYLKVISYWVSDEFQYVLTLKDA